jgi:hypothetical protein
MDASDLIKSLQRQPCEEGAVHIWGPDADRRARLLIHQATEGAVLDAYLHPVGAYECPCSVVSARRSTSHFCKEVGGKTEIARFEPFGEFAVNGLQYPFRVARS